MSTTSKVAAISVLFITSAYAASAQTTPPQTTTPQPTQSAPSATTTVPKAPAAAEQQPPVAGANSFTEAQAKDRINKAGYADVSSLQKDDAGVWRGSAVKDGKQMKVALDFRGNVVASD